MTTQYPKFISTLPIGEDRLVGNSHDNIAVSISKIIKNKNYEIKKQIIGLEGDWGAGKSNIIKIIQRDEDKYLKSDNYLHFIYDSWGHQEDLNRRALLEEIIDFLDYKEIIPKNEKWFKKKKVLNGKTITSVKNIFPEIKLFWVLFILSFLGYNFLNSIYPFIESYNFSIQYVCIGPWKNIISIWLIPVLLFLFGFIFLIQEIRLKLKENKDRKNKLSYNQILGQIFYLMNGKEIESNTTDYVIENEPTNKEFRLFLKDINNELFKKNKKLVITIDNIDRLTKEKVKGLWSTINIFFAENSENELYDSIWLIIPYDESKIINCFSENDDIEIGRGLIDKTFAVKFRVTPPLYSNWEQLLESNLIFAFGENFINDKSEIHFIKRIFDNYISESIIKPRQIINYVNDLVTLRLQYQEINYRYLALFSMTKNEIIKKPTENILSKSYINDNTKLLFNDDKELDKSISAIVFGVSLENAEEVLLDRKIESILMNGKVDELYKFSNIPSFPAFFEKKFTNISLQNIAIKNISLLPDILNKIEDLNLIEVNILRRYWKDLVKRLINDQYFHTQFYDLHKKIILKDFILGESILNKCVDVLISQVNNENSEKIYIDSLHEIDTFLNEKVEGFSFKKLKLKLRNITTFNYFYLLKIAPDNYKDYNLNSTHDEIIGYFYSNDDKKLDVRALFTELESLKLISNVIDLKEIITDLKTGLNGLNSVNINDIKYYYDCLVALSGTKPLEEVTINKEVINESLIRTKSEDKQVFILLLIFALKNAHDLSPHYQPVIFNEFQSSDETLAVSVASEIENIITFQKSIEIIVENNLNNNLSKNIVKEIIENAKLGNSLNISWVLINFDSIIESVFEKDDEQTQKFFKKLSRWNNYLVKNFSEKNLDIKKIDLLVFDYAIKIDNDLSKTLLNNANEYFESLDKVEWYKIFDNADEFSNKLFRKLNNKRINDELYTQNIIPYLVDYFKEFASGKINILVPQLSFLINILHKVDEPSIINFYKIITDCLNNNPCLNSIRVSAFIEPILKNNLLAKKPDESVNGVLKILINDNSLSSKFLSIYYKSYIDIIAKSKINKNSGIKTIRERLKNYGKKNEMRIYADKKLKNWSKLK